MLVNLKKENQETFEISEHIKRVKTPFIEPKLQNKEELKKFINDVIEDESLKEIFEGLIEKETLGLGEDNTVVLFSKNEKGENIGGLSFDIKDYNTSKLMQNSEKETVFIKNTNEDTVKSLIIIENLIFFLYSSQYADVLHMNFDECLENIELKDNVLVIVDNKRINEEKFLNNLEKLREKNPNISIEIELMENELISSALKKEYRGTCEIEEDYEMEI